MAGLPKARVNNLNQRMHDVGIFDQDLTLEDAQAINAFYNYTCLNCGAERSISLDHVKPIMSGGSNKRDNIQNLCESCNKAKGQREIDYRKGRICPDDFVAPSAQNKETYKKHDWDALQFEYVSTLISLRELAEKHKVFPTLLFKRAANERWLKNRENFGSKLVAEVQQEAMKQEVSARVMILEASRLALEEWKENDEKTDLAQLAKILELAARVEGLELDKRSVTIKDWRDVAGQNNTDPDELEQYFTALASADVPDVESGTGTEPGAGWTD